jgi:lipoprotein
MKTKILTALSICFVFVLMVSCISRKPERQTLPEPIVIENIKTVEKETIVRDTIILTPKDSIRTIVKIECPDGGKPKIKDIKYGQKGSILKLPEVSLNGNQLTIDCKAQAEKLALKLYDKYVKEHENKIQVQYREKPFAWYHKALMWVGGAFLLSLVIQLILFIKSKI